MSLRSRSECRETEFQAVGPETEKARCHYEWDEYGMRCNEANQLVAGLLNALREAWLRFRLTVEVCQRQHGFVSGCFQPLQHGVHLNTSTMHTHHTNLHWLTTHEVLLSTMYRVHQRYYDYALYEFSISLLTCSDVTATTRHHCIIICECWEWWKYH